MMPSMEATRSIFVVTGASGVGKTTTVRALEARGVPGVAFWYFDDIGVPDVETMRREHGSPEGWQADATRQWIARLAQADADVVHVLDGQVRPSAVLEAAKAHPHVRVQMILFDCTSEVRTVRLTARGQPEAANEHMNRWGAYLLGQAHALGMPVIDTSELDVDAAVDACMPRIRSAT
jgi:2-phosphoglycerate kinase